MDRTSQRFFCLSDKFTPIGQAEWTTVGTFQWICPAGVESVSAVAIGAGSTLGAGGGLGWRASIATIPGTTYNVKVGASTTGDGTSFFLSEATVCGRRGTTTGGNFVGDGGGNGGNVGISDGTPNGFGSGAGGAAGYAGNGGNGGGCANGVDTPNGSQNGTAGTSGTGGAGGGGGGGMYENTTVGSNTTRDYYSGAGAGGVSIYGQGSNGVGGLGGSAANGRTGKAGKGGSSGAIGADGGGLAPEDRSGGNGGTYGAGGGRLGGRRLVDGTSFIGGVNGEAQNGAVRIIWGQGRFYPSNRTGNE